MPTSLSRKQNTKLPAAEPKPRLMRPLILIAVLAVLVVILVVFPASMVKRFLPRALDAQDFSGTLWHGSAGRVAFDGRNLGAIEWHLHPWSLLSLAVVANVHWVKTGFVADGDVEFNSENLTLRNVQGGGPIDDLRELGLADGWHGTSSFKFSELTVALSGQGGNGSITWSSAVGDLNVFNLTSQQVAGGVDLGGYTLHLANVAITPGADATADLADTGGPLEVRATIHFSADGRTGMLSGTIKARADAPPALVSRLEPLTQLHARDSRGAIPVDLEFTL